MGAREDHVLIAVQGTERSGQVVNDLEERRDKMHNIGFLLRFLPQQH